MSDDHSVDFVRALAENAAEIVSACVQCGKCFVACPMTDAVGLAKDDAPLALSGTIDLLKGGQGNAVAEKWVNACTSSGYCIQACDYGVNPRSMVRLAKSASQANKKSPEEIRKNAFSSFRTMTRSARIVPRLQYADDELERISPRVQGVDDGANVDVVFYTGCNLLKVPHIAFLCLAVMDALHVSYKVAGGAAACCGVFQWNEGDQRTSGKVAYNTIKQLAKPRAVEVLSWCPTCQTQFSEVGLPSYERSHGAKPFDMRPFVTYLERRLHDLKPLFKFPVNKRVSLNERPAIPEAMTAIKRLLNAIPGLEFVDLAVPRVGMMSNYLNVTPDFKSELIRKEFQAAQDAGVTTFATVYHACHRELCNLDDGWSFEIVNFMDLIGEAMGISVPDRFKDLKKLANMDDILAAAKAKIEVNELESADVRAVIEIDMLSTKSVGRYTE